jgi:F420-non-reducing hydrogenase small subunit
MLSALASIMDVGDENNHYSQEDIDKMVAQIKDPIGTFYMYALPASILRRKVIKK